MKLGKRTMVKWEKVEKRTAWKRSWGVVVDRGYRREERREDEMAFKRGNGGSGSGGVSGSTIHGHFPLK